MKANAMLLLVAAALVAGCGSSTEKTDFPPLKTNEAGNKIAPVKDQAEAEKLCDAAQKDWPYGDEVQISFDIPDTGSDVTCMKPG